MRHPALALAALALALAVAPAAARPPALLWRAGATEAARREATPLPSRFAGLVIRLDAAGATLLSSAVAESPLKFRQHAPSGDGLFFVVRDASGTALLAGETFDARFELHGDEPDPLTGTLRSLSVMRDEATFSLRVPLVAGASDVALFVPADPRQSMTAAELLEAVRSGSASLMPRGVLPLPPPASGDDDAGTSP